MAAAMQLTTNSLELAVQIPEAVQVDVMVGQGLIVLSVAAE
jgi:hypothetical protein